MAHPQSDIDFEQYKTQAKELLKSARAGVPEALERVRTRHPESAALLSLSLPGFARCATLKQDAGAAELAR